MRVLFTGATSFTGTWFVRSLAERGHQVLAVQRNAKKAYAGLKARRLSELSGLCDFAWDAPFGSAAFQEIVEQAPPFDLLCHHAANAENYKSPDFDAASALADNTLSLRHILVLLRSRGCRRVVLTGSVFEAHEGAGSSPLGAFSAYGLSKTLTAESFVFHTGREGLALGKFVIPNPFGPLEEPRFTDYLLRCWKAGKSAQVNTPRYVRDNIPVSLLAAAYARFAEKLPEIGFHKINPSFYVETQGVFAQRFAREITSRLDIEAPVELAEQTDFSEPQIRINTDFCDGITLGWNEHRFWDEAAKYYADRFQIALR